MRVFKKISGGRCAAGGLFLALILATVSAASAAPAAQHKDEIRRSLEEKRKLMDKVFSELDLSREQVQAIEERRSHHLKNKEHSLGLIAEKKDALRQALDAPDADPVVINALADELAALQTERMKNRVAAILEIKKILTPEQYAELREKKKALKEQHQEIWKDKTEENF